VETEREFWMSIPVSDPDWIRKYIVGTGISDDDTIDGVVSAFPDNPLRILEIGCGFGRLTSRVASLYPDAEVIGTDVNSEILGAGLPGPRYVCIDNLTGLHDFDVIYSVTVFQHLARELQHCYVTEAGMALRSGGVFRLQFIEGDRDNFCDHWTPLDQMVEWFADAGLTIGAIEHGVAHYQWTWMTGVA
jgi:trans-aconitate 2-methyltransferase